MYVSPAVHVSNKLIRAKYSYWNAIAMCDIETRRYSLSIDLHIQVHLIEAHIKFCQPGNQVEIKTYGER